MYTYEHVCTYINVYIYICTHTHIHTFFIYSVLYTYIYIHSYIHAYKQIYTSALYTHTHTHTHTHSHSHSHTQDISVLRRSALYHAALILLSISCVKARYANLAERVNAHQSLLLLSALRHTNLC
jgi:hypothetical protein